MSVHDKHFGQQTDNKMHNTKRRSTSIRDFTSTSVSGEVFKTNRKNKTTTTKPLINQRTPKHGYN